MGIIITCVVCWLAWKLFERWLFSDNNKKSSNATQSSKSESQEQYVKYAVTAIEKAHKIATVYPPEFLKGRICNFVCFGNTANEEIVINPTYKVSIKYNGKSSADDFATFLRDQNRNKYYGGWSLSFSDNEFYDEYPTYDITWLQLKNRVISELEKRHPEWKVSDLETYVSIWF